MAATYPCDSIIWDSHMHQKYGFAAASLTVYQLAKRMLPGPISLRWHLASPPTRLSPNQEWWDFCWCLHRVRKVVDGQFEVSKQCYRSLEYQQVAKREPLMSLHISVCCYSCCTCKILHLQNFMDWEWTTKIVKYVFCKINTNNIIMAYAFQWMPVTTSRMCNRYILQPYVYTCTSNYSCRCWWMCAAVSLWSECHMYQHSWVIHMYLQWRLHWRWNDLHWCVTAHYI